MSDHFGKNPNRPTRQPSESNPWQQDPFMAYDDPSVDPSSFAPHETGAAPSGPDAAREEGAPSSARPDFSAIPADYGMQAVANMEAERTALREKRLAAREAVQQQEIAVARDTERRKNAESELTEHTQSVEDTRQAVEQLDESITGLETELAHTEALTGREQTDAEAMRAQV